MRGFIELAVRRRVSVVMAVLAVIAFGVVGYQRLALELFPDITYPSLSIQTEFPDTAPQEVENLVTRPLEEAVGVLRGLQTIHSVSRPGYSEVTLEFEWGSDMDLLSMEVREKIDRLIMPEEATDPVVLRYDPSLDPIIRLAISGGDLMVLRRLADKQIKQDFETIKGVAAAQIKGGLEEEIQVEVDQNRLAALGITLEQVRQVVGVSNVNLPGGALRSEDSQYLIRTINEFDDVQEIANLIIRHQNGANVRLKEVAEVYWGHKERDEITRVRGQESVEISLYKEGDANTVTVARLLHGRIAEWQSEGKLPEGVSMSVLFDQSQFIQQAVTEVRNAALYGGLLAIILLMLFLRDVRSTAIIATSIPISVVATFIAMYRMDISLNIMSLGGLTLGIGMLVDNSIVVLEAIYRRRQEGMDLVTAAVVGTSEVGRRRGGLDPDHRGRVSAHRLRRGHRRTALPRPGPDRHLQLAGLAAGGGDPHPHAQRRWAARPRGSPESGRRARPTDEMHHDRAHDRRAFSRLGAYSRALRPPARFDGPSRRHRADPAPGLRASSPCGPYLRCPQPGQTELIPQLSEGEFFFEVTLPEGTSPRCHRQACCSAWRPLPPADSKEVALDYATVGSRLGCRRCLVTTKAENLGQLNVVLTDRADDEAAESGREPSELRRSLRRHPRPRDRSSDGPALLQPQDPGGGPSSSARTWRLLNRDAYRLDVADVLARNVPGLVDVRSSLEAGNPELQVIFDRDRLASLGLDMDHALSGRCRTGCRAWCPRGSRRQDRQIDIRVRNREADRNSLRTSRTWWCPAPRAVDLRLVSAGRRARVDRGPGRDPPPRSSSAPP
jgi:multidrug efflux pump subunit AcrB